MTDKKNPVAVIAKEIPPRTKPSVYPEPFFSKMAGRKKRQLGDFFGLKNFGVNLTQIQPGGQSALFHRHSKQDEFIYILEGTPTLITDESETLLTPGMCAGFPAGGTAHQLLNRSESDVWYLEVGDRTMGDEGTYPRDDLKAILESDGSWKFIHKDGTPY
ncbi:MAG: cupin domain-containing protein [Bacteriovorax sp.]